MENKTLPCIFLLIDFGLSLSGGVHLAVQMFDTPNLLLLLFAGIFGICPIVLFYNAAKKVVASGGPVLEDNVSMICAFLLSIFAAIGLSNILGSIGLGAALSWIISIAITLLLLFLMPSSIEAILSK